DSIVIDSIVEKEIKGVKISTVEDYHDPQMGRQRGRVRIYKLTIEDTTIVHVGDLGRIPDEDKINWMKNVDIFLVPVGGTFTLGGSEAATLVKKVTPKVTIPMHYKVPGLRLPISGVDSFLKHFSDIEQVDSNIYEVIKPLPEGKIVVLKPPR
ncbi:MAG: MBL fold metallo-hydrolase, partial [Candidatus Asgardarchaeia archaeon]